MAGKVEIREMAPKKKREVGGGGGGVSATAIAVKKSANKTVKGQDCIYFVGILKVVFVA